MNKVTVNPKLLEWASDRSTKGRAELDGRFPKLSRWIAGDEAPTLNQLEDFSQATSTPLGFLFLNVPPLENLNIPHYRTLDDRRVREPSTELLDTLHAMERRQDWLREYLTSEGRPPVPLVNCAKQAENPKAVADRIGKLLDLDPGWASKHRGWTDAQKALRAAMGTAGVVVVVNGVVGNNTHRPLDVEEFRGFVLVDAHAPLVFVNGADSPSAQMFTLAHEAAHLAFGVSAAFDLRQMQPSTHSTEQACNRVAAEFLVPEVMLRQVWKSDDPNPYESVSRVFKVSQLVAARRLLDLKLVTRAMFLDFYQGYINQERTQKDAEKPGGHFHNTTPQRVGMRFAVELVHAYQEGRVLPTEAYRLTGLKRNSFEELARRTQEGGWNE